MRVIKPRLFSVLVSSIDKFYLFEFSFMVQSLVRSVNESVSTVLFQSHHGFERTIYPHHETFRLAGVKCRPREAMNIQIQKHIHDAAVKSMTP